LVGENNSGKSSLLSAIYTALGKRRPLIDDLWRDANGQIAASAQIDIFFSPPVGTNAFSNDMRQRLVAVQREPGSTREMVGIRTTLKPSSEGVLLLENRVFLQPLSNDWVEAPAPPFQGRVLELVQAHMIDASRDLVAEMGNQTSAWGRVLSDLKIPDLPDLANAQLDPAGKRALEQDLRLISERVRQASPVLTQLHDDLKAMANTQASVGNVALVALPLRIEELAKTIEILLQQSNAAQLPLRFHGLGSRSLAALLVFRTMCVLKIGADHGVKPHLITLLEEPEAHLHPHAITALIATIAQLPGQRILSTHSPTLVADVTPACVRILRRDSNSISVTSLGPDTPKKMEQFRRFFGRPFGEMFFARLAVLGDGVTERNALPILVGLALRIDPAALGVTFIDSKSMSNHRQLNPILSALHELRIPWLCYADNDTAGIEALTKLVDPSTGNPLAVGHPNVVLVQGTKQIEQMLIDADYRVEITQLASDVGQQADTDPLRRQFLAAQKGWAAEVVALKAKAAGKPAPQQLSPLIEAIRIKLGMPTPAPTVAAPSTPAATP